MEFRKNFANFKIVLSKFRVSRNFKHAVSHPPYSVPYRKYQQITNCFFLWSGGRDRRRRWEGKQGNRSIGETKKRRMKGRGGVKGGLKGGEGDRRMKGRG